MKLTDRQIVKQALITAIQWELNLLDTHWNVRDDPEYKEFIDLVKSNIRNYKRVLEK